MRFTVKRISFFLFLRLDRDSCNCGTGGFNRVDHFACGFADTIQRGFQLRQFLAFAPTSDIGKGIIRGVDPEVLAYHIGNALSLYLAGMVILIRFSDDLAVFYRQGVKPGVGRLMDQRL